MKHLKTFEDQTYNGAMKNMDDIEPEFTPPFEPGSEDEVIQRYCEKYPEFSEFFENFLERFPDKETFDDRLWEYFDEDEDFDEDDYDEDDEDDEADEDDDEDDDDDEADEDDDEFGRRWSPEAEVNMLENEVDGKYPGSEIWPDLFNDLCETDWNNKK